ncbi:MAG: heparan-alpha-glucosaminide N-acetyltransferase domain-containing protein [Acutalibacteraceae bacterium]|nr:heparan-alpha-glucosaminide N-acetyltransferase domain-containing protein [Acutalibacteraceae bacterium]
MELTKSKREIKTYKIEKTQRIHMLDEIRGLAVIAMILYHLFYSMTFIFNMECSYSIMSAIYPYEPIIPITFITISGIVCSFSRNNLKRGLIVFGVAIGITLVTGIFIPSQVILFGILHFLGIALILYGILQKAFAKIPVGIGLTIFLILFIFCYNIPKGYIGISSYANIQLPQQLYSVYALSFIGFPSSDFISSDYFPIIPYIFLFFAGTFIGRIFKEKGVPKFMYKKLCPPLDFIGKHALIIYVAHQPIIIAVLYVLNMVEF